MVFREAETRLPECLRPKRELPPYRERLLSLVVQTVGFSDGSWLDFSGHPLAKSGA